MQRFMTARDAITLGDNRKAIKCKTLVALISMVQKHIQFIIAVNDKTRDLLWKCPAIIPDFPLFNIPEMCRDIKAHLIRQGFHAEYVRTNYLYINWSQIHQVKKQTVSILPSPPIQSDIRNFNELSFLPQKKRLKGNNKK